MMAVDIVFETHSTSEDNERGIATGWLPGALSAAGRQQARALGARRRGTGLNVIFTSDLRRAVETAELAFDGAGLPIRTDWRLRECNYGRHTGMPSAQLAAERLARVDVPFPDGESYRQVVERVRTFLDDLARDCDAQQVLVIGHAATHFALQHLLEGAALEAVVEAPDAWQPGWNYQLAGANG
ncbi:MAG TPA: histidine phosphatase family protein [Chloroflexota bacterium]|nr:histidine phosphatase family protein [Chloroflexota bacterium]